MVSVLSESHRVQMDSSFQLATRQRIASDPAGGRMADFQKTVTLNSEKVPYGVSSVDRIRDSGDRGKLGPIELTGFEENPSSPGR